MSNFYLDIIKDRLYCDDVNSVSRKAAQTTMYRILSAITRLIAPIMSFTADEIWSYIPHSSSDNAKSVFLNDMPSKSNIKVDEKFSAKWNLIAELREDVKKALEIKRADKVIGKSLEADVIIYANEEKSQSIVDFIDELPEIFIVSKVELKEGKGEFDGELEGITIDVIKATGEKCDRCWKFDESVGTHSDHPTLCDRCHSVISK